jgi:exodeoxyribonuclease VII large subunit
MAQWQLDGYRRSLRMVSPLQRVRNLAQRLDEIELRAGRAVSAHLRTYQGTLDSLARALNAVSPQATLARGYAIVKRAADAGVVTDPAQVTTGDRLEIQVHRGRLAADVVE